MTDEELAQHLPGERHETMQLPGAMHVLLTALLDGPGAVDPEDGMLVKEIVEELLSNSDYAPLTPAEYFTGCSTPAAKNAKVKADLDVMTRARINVQPFVERSEAGRAVRYAITDRGERVLELHRALLRREISTGANVALPTLLRGNSLSQQNRMGALELEEDDDTPPDEVDLSTGLSPEYASVELGRVTGHVIGHVMLGCLGAEPLLTYSPLFCPLIFLALNPEHDAYADGMAFWQSRFTWWDHWVVRIRANLPENTVLDIDGGSTQLMFGQPGSRYIPHYTADAQVTVLTAAGIAHEVDACAQRTFQKAPLPHAPASMAAGASAEQPPSAAPAPAPAARAITAPAVAPAAAFRGLGASAEQPLSAAPAFRSLAASEGAAQPADSEAATTQEDDVDDEATWWRSLM